MSRAQIHRNRLLARAAGTVGAVAVALGATVAPAGAASPVTGHGHTPGKTAADVTPDATNAPAGADDLAAAHAHAEAKANAKAAAQAERLRAATARHHGDDPVATSIPAPTGPFQVGTVNLHLVDKHRYDPWVPGHPRRELMVQLWYPATKTASHELAPWLSAGAVDHYLAGWNTSAELMQLPTTAGHLGAPVDPRAGKLPVLLYSTGLHSDRSVGDSLAQDMASRGYLVITIDHTHDAGEVEFPGDRLETASPTSGQWNLTVRSADVKFVIDQLALIAAGKDPDVDHAPLPAGLARHVDMTRVGMFGWSMGGGAVDTAMQLDPRIAAGADLDGQFYGSAMTKDLNRPFLLFGAQYHDRKEDHSWATVWSHLHGPRYELRLADTKHLSFSDYEFLFSQAGEQMGQSPDQVQQEIGTLDPNRTALVIRTYLAAFFDKELRHKPVTLLNGPSSRFPEISFVP